MLQLISDINKCAHEVLQLGRNNSYQAAHAKITEDLDGLNQELERRCLYHQVMLPDNYTADEMHEALLAYTEADQESDLNDYLIYGSNSQYSEEAPDFHLGASQK